MAPSQDYSHPKTRQRPFSRGKLSTNFTTVSVLQMSRAPTILQRIKPVLEESTIVEQAGFRSGRSTCDQVLALSTFIENGFHFQLKQKTGAVFLDLTAAYDTVWHLGLLLKLSKILPTWVVDTGHGGNVPPRQTFSSAYGRHD